MIDDIIVYFTIAFLSSLNSHIEKIGIKSVNPYNFRFYKNILIGVISFFLFFYLAFKENNSLQIEKMDKITTLILVVSSVFSIITGLCVYYLFDKKFVSEVIPLSISFTIIVGAIIGYLFFSEKLNFTKIFGIIICVSGILLIKMSNSKK